MIWWWQFQPHSQTIITLFVYKGDKNLINVDLFFGSYYFIIVTWFFGNKRERTNLTAVLQVAK
jgi:hypothetical protein